jgi:putative component of membrane protein insertase Oxa1/YidC/SpoIIIJ protein YidD
MNETETHLTLPVRAAVRLLSAYQGAASGKVSPCRFYPSCSNYAVEAFTEHGVDLVPLHVHSSPAMKVDSIR